VASCNKQLNFQVHNPACRDAPYQVRENRIGTTQLATLSTAAVHAHHQVTSGQGSGSRLYPMIHVNTLTLQCPRIRQLFENTAAVSETVRV
jgi:hypothetical protein